MKIAHIHASSEDGNALTYQIDYLTVSKEDETCYIVNNHEDGFEPRGNWISKEIDEEAVMDGYVSLNMPSWVRCEYAEATAVIYVREEDIEKGKFLLKEALLKTVDKHIQRYEALKKLIQG